MNLYITFFNVLNFKSFKVKNAQTPPWSETFFLSFKYLVFLFKKSYSILILGHPVRKAYKTFPLFGAGKLPAGLDRNQVA